MSEEYIGWLDDEWNTVLDQSQPIVRCRDCRYYDTHTEPPECYREVPGRIVAPGGFCAWGSRRDA